MSAASTLTDADVRHASLLPGWTVGHVLAHVARNADSHRRRTEAALRAEIVEQYPGGFSGRAAEIEAGADRPISDLLDDVARSAEAMQAAWETVPPEGWDRTTRDVGGRERPLRELPRRRWQELEVHVVDLGIGVSHHQWSDEFVAGWLPRLRAGVADRLPPGAVGPEPGVLDPRDELAWLYGRLERPDLPPLVPWS